MVDSAAVEAAVRRALTRRPSDAVAVYLFGSVARNEASGASDVDLAVLLRRDSPPTLDGLGLDLAGDLEADLGVPVDVVILNGAPVDLAYRVLRDGRLLHDSDPSARIRFEVRTRNEYFDLKPMLDRYRRVRSTLDPSDHDRP